MAVNTKPMDPFTHRRLRELGRRLLDLRAEQDRIAGVLWAGSLATSFRDDELTVLREAGLLSLNDEHAIESARNGRRVGIRLTGMAAI